jgi:hypothetical protein
MFWRNADCLFIVGFLLDFLFDLGDGDNVFHQNIGGLLPNWHYSPDVDILELLEFLFEKFQMMVYCTWDYRASGLCPLYSVLVQ